MVELPRPLPRGAHHPLTRQARSPQPFELVPPNLTSVLPCSCSTSSPIFACFMPGVGENVVLQCRFRYQKRGSAGLYSDTARAHTTKLGRNPMLHMGNMCSDFGWFSAICCGAAGLGSLSRASGPRARWACTLTLFKHMPPN